MRNTLLLYLLCLPMFSYASTIDCYSGGKNIYHGAGNEVFYTGDYVAFTEYGTGKTVFLFAECIVKMSQSEIAQEQKKILMS